jgi:hypothetical protein
MENSVDLGPGPVHRRLGETGGALRKIHASRTEMGTRRWRCETVRLKETF